MPLVSAIRDQARENLNIDPGKSLWTDVQLLRWLNEGAAMLHAEMDWKDIEQSSTITLVDATSTYSPASDYMRLRRSSVKFTPSGGSKGPVKYIELVDLEEAVNDLTQTGDVPQYVYETNGLLGFYPTPNSTMAAGTLNYSYYEWPDTYAASDTPDFPAQWHFILEHYIEYRAWGILPGMEANASLALQKWERELNRMKAERLRRTGPTFAWTSVSKQSKTTY